MWHPRWPVPVQWVWAQGHRAVGWEAPGEDQENVAPGVSSGLPAAAVAVAGRGLGHPCAPLCTHVAPPCTHVAGGEGGGFWAAFLPCQGHCRSRFCGQRGARPAFSPLEAGAGARVSPCAGAAAGGAGFASPPLGCASRPLPRALPLPPASVRLSLHVSAACRRCRRPRSVPWSLPSLPCAFHYHINKPESCLTRTPHTLC